MDNISEIVNRSDEHLSINIETPLKFLNSISNAIVIITQVAKLNINLINSNFTASLYSLPLSSQVKQGQITRRSEQQEVVFLKSQKLLDVIVNYFFHFTKIVMHDYVEDAT